MQGSIVRNNIFVTTLYRFSLYSLRWQKPTHPAFNIAADRVQSTYEYFSKLASPHFLHKDKPPETEEED